MIAVTEDDAQIRWRRGIARNVMIVFGCAAIAFALSVFATVRIGGTADDVADQQDLVLTQQATITRQQRQIRALLAAVQESRYDATLRACRFRNGQEQRHPLHRPQSAARSAAARRRKTPGGAELSRPCARVGRCKTEAEKSVAPIAR